TIQDLIPRKKGVKPVAVVPKEPVPLPSERLANAWTQLAAHDDDGCQRALALREQLAKTPDLLLPFLRERLKPAAPVNATVIAKLIADLDSNDFATRDKATK